MKMGLLEKAYEYKKEINRKGGMTLIDTIEGPAETKMIKEDSNSKFLENTSSWSLMYFTYLSFSISFSLLTIFVSLL